MTKENHKFFINGKFQKIFTKISEEGTTNIEIDNQKEILQTHISEINEWNMSDEFKDVNSS